MEIMERYEGVRLFVRSFYETGDEEKSKSLKVFNENLGGLLL